LSSECLSILPVSWLLHHLLDQTWTSPTLSMGQVFRLLQKPVSRLKAKREGLVLEGHLLPKAKSESKDGNMLLLPKAACRTGGLDPKTKEKARRIRKVGACWSCWVQKVPVSVIPRTRTSSYTNNLSVLGRRTLHEM
jgi:predicted Zn-ribbon and HTH transcriptional regulator